ncbi:heterokaryon incompatibility protein-domain-containing protein [Xylaria arbuscula]|nr:heterokaryon incompatibility protein-domain-containing protein [Xylaria arbuscula]
MALQHYCPLKPENREIRLLSLEPGSSSDDIYIRLYHHCLSATAGPSYEALSYVWGLSQNDKAIQIRKQNGQTQQMFVTQNLYIALTQLRHERSTRDLWVDAICIDQSNVVERSQQVAMMGDIYRGATRVIAWLGLEGNNSTYALQFMSSLSSQVIVNWVTNDVEFSDTCETQLSVDRSGRQRLLMSRRECDAIYHILMRPWFERLWIRQEIALGSRNGILLCGEESIPWSDFRDAFLCIYCRVEPDAFENMYEPFLARGQLIYGLATMQSYGTLEESREQIGQSKRTDPRDKIYGILNIISDADQKIGIYPDYSASVAETFQNTASQWIKHYRSLNILLSCEMAPTTADIPSWVPDWSTPLASQPVWRPVENDSWADDLVLFSFPNTRTLRLFGVACATMNGRYDLAGIKPGMNPHAVSDELRKILSLGLQAAPAKHYKTGETATEAIYRTLGVGEFSDSYYPPSTSVPGYQDYFSVIKDLSQDEVSRFTRSYADSISQFARGRCFFTTEEGHIGMAASSAQTGDIVCDILGCDIPLLLRPIVKGPNKCYQLVSHCYIHGLMGHEAILGELPANYQQIFYYDESKGEHMIGYLNHISKEIQKEDPRPRRQEVERMAMSLRETMGISKLEEEYSLKIWRDSGVDIMPFDVI